MVLDYHNSMLVAAVVVAVKLMVRYCVTDL